jgi:hypothetical protein
VLVVGGSLAQGKSLDDCVNGTIDAQRDSDDDE